MTQTPENAKEIGRRLGRVIREAIGPADQAILAELSEDQFEVVTDCLLAAAFPEVYEE